jgi:hypothetical protein
MKSMLILEMMEQINKRILSLYHPLHKLKVKVLGLILIRRILAETCLEVKSINHQPMGRGFQFLEKQHLMRAKKN